MGTYRGRLDIIADILHVVSKNAKKTQIMYQANLSYKVLQRYLSELVGASLICFQDERQCYALTEKGQEFLITYKGYCKTNRNLEKRTNDLNGKKKILDDLCPADN